MKRFPLIFLSLLIAACSGGMDASRPFSVRARMESMPAKAVVGDLAEGVYPVHWQEGDRISLNGAMSQALPAASSGSAEAEFKFDACPEGKDFRFLFPGNAEGQVRLDGTSVPMFAEAASLEGTIAFRQLCIGICIRLTGAFSLSSLTLRAEGGEAVCGVFKVAFPDGTLEAVKPESTLSRSFPVPLAPDSGALCWFIAPGTYSEGLTLEACSPEEYTLKWRFAAGETLVRGKMYAIPALAFTEPKDEEHSFEDGCPATLEEMTEQWIEPAL